MTEVSASNDYPYHTYIKSPDQIKSSSKGTLTALNNDIDDCFNRCLGFT